MKAFRFAAVIIFVACLLAVASVCQLFGGADPFVDVD